MHQYEALNTGTTQVPPTVLDTDSKLADDRYTSLVLPPKSFGSAKTSKLKRGLYQSSVGLGGFLIWATLFVLWQWALNKRLAEVFFSSGYYYDGYSYGSDHYKPHLMLSTADFFQVCDAQSYSSLEPTLLLHGNFTLGAVKAMDISFNLVIGRGSQALLLWISYYATTDILMRLMENTRVRFDLFYALAFNHASFTTTFPVLKGVFTLRGWRAKAIMAWIFISWIFLTILPTLVDTMSGYIQNQLKDIVWKEGENTVTTPYDNWNYTAWNQTHPDSKYTTTCTPQDGYQWGLVELWVSITLLLFGFWLLGTYSIWMDAQHACELRRKGRGLETLRAVVDLADAVQDVLGDEISAYSGKELRKAMERSPEVMYGIEVDEKDRLEKIRLGSRVTAGLPELSWDTAYG